MATTTNRFHTLPPSLVVTLEKIERIFGHQFQNTLLLWRALQDMKIPLPGFSHEKAFPDGNRRLALLGRFVVGLVFTENVNSGAKDAETLEKFVGNFGSSTCQRYVGEKVGLTKLLLVNDESSKCLEGDVAFDMCVRAMFGALYLDAGLDGVRKTLGFWNDKLGGRQKGKAKAKEHGGNSWLDLVLRPEGEGEGESESEGESSGGDKANPDLGRDVEMKH